MGDKGNWLVAYDVANSRQRHHLRILLRGFGAPLQKSVFLCRLSPGRLERLRRLLSRQSLGTGDRLGLFHVVSADYLAGDAPAPFGPGDLVIME